MLLLCDANMSGAAKSADCVGNLVCVQYSFNIRDLNVPSRLSAVSASQLPLQIEGNLKDRDLEAPWE